MAHEILVSAQDPLVFGFWVWGFGVWGLGLTILLLVLQIYLWTDDASIPKLQNISSWNIRHVSTLNLTIPEVIKGESSEKKAGWGWIGCYTDLLRYIFMKLRPILS